MRKNKLLSVLLIVIFLALFVHYFSSHKEDFAGLLNLNPWLLIIVAAGYIGLIFTSGVFIKLVMQPFDKKISYLESFKVSLLSAIGNYFGPLLGGTGIRAVYLKKKVGLNYSDFVSTLYGYYVIVFLMSSLFGLSALLLLRERSEEASYLFIALFFIGIFLATLAIVFNKKLSIIGRLLNKAKNLRVAVGISKLAAGWHKIVAYPGLIKNLSRITFLNIAIFFVMNYIEFLLIGVKPSIGSIMLYTALGIFSILVSLTPAALGIREGIFLLSAGALGVTSSQILAVAVIDRSVQFIVMLGAWAFIATHKKSKKSQS